jgi:transposase
LPVIPSCCNATRKAQCHKIENFFCGAKDWRPVATRYDKHARGFLAAVLMIGTLCWIKL